MIKWIILSANGLFYDPYFVVVYGESWVNLIKWEVANLNFLRLYFLLLWIVKRSVGRTMKYRETSVVQKYRLVSRDFDT